MGAELERVVAVVATLADGREQWGSGFLLTDTLVLTAEHCTRNRENAAEAPVGIRVLRAVGGQAAVDLSATVTDPQLDVAVLSLTEPSWNEGWAIPVFGRVDRSQTGILEDCQGSGFPLYQRDPRTGSGGGGLRRSSEFHARIYQTDHHEDGHLLMREPLVIPGEPDDPSEAAGWPWGGLSGSAVFYRDHLLGVVVEHHPKHGANAIRLIGMETISAAASAAAVRDLLGLTSSSLPLVSGQPDGARVAVGVERREVVWPVVPRPAPALAQAYQDRDVTTRLPRSGTVVLSGSSGFGKTQVAAAVFATSNADLRLWIPATSRDQILSGYADAAVAVGVADPTDGIETRALRMLGWLTAPPLGRSWLVVLDDLTDPANMHATDNQIGCWPPIVDHGLSVITTLSRGPDLSGEGRRLERVDHYTRQESVGYLAQRLTDPDVIDDLPAEILDQADELAVDMDGHPLALAQAAAVIIADQSTIAAYRVKLASTTLDRVLPETARADGYTRPLHKAFQLALDRAIARSPGAGRLLSLLGMLDPTGAPVELLHTQPVQDFLNATDLDGANLRVAKGGLAALSALSELSMTSYTPRLGPRAVRTHPLTGRLAREHAGGDVVIAAGKAAAAAVFECWPERELDSNQMAAFWSSAAALIGHDAHLGHQVLLGVSNGIHPLLFRHNNSLGSSGLLGDAINYAIQFQETANILLGPDHPHTIAIRSSLARWHGSAGNLGAATEISQKLLVDYTRVLGPDHPNTLATRNNIAYWRGEAGDPAGAAEAFEELLVDLVRVLGPDHPDTLTIRNNVVRWRGEAGDSATAAALEELLVDRVRVLGPDHPDTLTTRANVAHWHGRVDPVGAVASFEDLLVDFQRVFGHDHPETFTARSNLARLRGEAGDSSGAAEAFEELLVDRLRVLGPDHPDTLTTRSNLARLQGEAGDSSGAAEAFEELLVDYVRVLGPDHPNTLATRNSIVYWRREAGDPAGAAEELEELLVDRLRVLGPDHPDVLTTRNNIAYQLGLAGDSSGAAEAYEELLVDYVRVLGPDHLKTLTVRSNLAFWREEAGDSVGASVVGEELLLDQLRVLGPDHLDTLSTRASLALWRGKAGDPIGAVQSLEKLLSDSLRALGTDHPFTLLTRRVIDYWRGQLADSAE